MNEIKIRVLTGDLKRQEINLNDITREEALAYANENKIICVSGLSNKGPMFWIEEKHINAIYDSGILADSELLEYAKYFIEVSNLARFINCVKEKGQHWIYSIDVLSCEDYALKRMPREMARYVECINLEELGEDMALDNGLYVTDDKHVVRIS